MRFIGGGDFTERSLSCIAEVPQGALVWIMEGDTQSVLEATDAACGDSLAALGGGLRLGMIAFDCIARRNILGEGGIRAGNRPARRDGVGRPSRGSTRMGRSRGPEGSAGFHNQTLVVLSIG